MQYNKLLMELELGGTIDNEQNDNVQYTDNGIFNKEEILEQIRYFERGKGNI